MTILGCAGSPEEGSNFNPPTMGEFMRNQKISKLQVLRESRAGAAVIKEAHDFHQRKALKYGIETARGLAHMRASRMFGREAGMSLQEKFEQGGDPSQLGELPPQAVMKANKAAMMFHKKSAEKAGLDSDLGHAHTAAMEHHMDIMKKAKDQMGQQQPAQPQQPMQASSEGGPGSGPQGGRKGKWPNLDSKKWQKLDKELSKRIGRSRGKGKWPNLDAPSRKKEAAPGVSGKQSPMPVPQKSDMPSQDVRMPVPSVPLQKLQQGSEWGPQYVQSKGWGTPMKMSASKRIRRIDRFGEGEDCNPSSVNDQLGKDKIFFGKKPKPMKDNSELTSKEARRGLRRRPIWETDDSERDRSASGLTA
jgi:hypothetical protein